MPAALDTFAQNLDAAFWLTAGGIVLLLVLSAFFSGSETALTAASRAKLRAQADKGSHRAATALRVTDDNERMIGALLMGNNVANILSASLAALRGLDVLKIAMKPYFVPETTPLDEQMRQFLRRRTHFALVVDEYGSLRGLITLEDILEEIVGQINDEHDVDPDHPLKRSENGDYLVEGAMTIRDLNRAMDWALPDDEANTVAGLVIHEAQMIPAEGQVFSYHGFRFEVAARRENRITKLRIRPL